MKNLSQSSLKRGSVDYRDEENQLGISFVNPRMSLRSHNMKLADETMDVEFTMTDFGKENWKTVENNAIISSQVESRPTSIPNSDSSVINKAVNVLQLSTLAILGGTQSDFTFKDYCPKLFERVRGMCGISPVQYAESFRDTCKQKFSEGYICRHRIRNQNFNT